MRVYIKLKGKIIYKKKNIGNVICFYRYCHFKVSYSYVKYYNFKMFITHFKIIKLIKAYDISDFYCYLYLNLMICKFTLILKLTSQNLIKINQQIKKLNVKCVRQRQYIRV